MAHSFIDIGEKGFWSHDGFVEAMQLCLINEIELFKPYSDNWLNQFKEALAMQSIHKMYGAMSMELEEFLTETQRKETIKTLIDSISKKIDSDDSYLTGKNLNGFKRRAAEILVESGNVDLKGEKDLLENLDYRWKDDAPINELKERYLHAFKLLKKLIEGEMETDASSPINYWNY